MGVLEKDSIRASVRSALEMATIPDLDEVMQRLEDGIDTDDVSQYTIDLTGRADDLLQKLLEAAEPIAAVADDDQRREMTRASVTSLLDDMYPQE